MIVSAHCPERVPGLQCSMWEPRGTQWFCWFEETNFRDVKVARIWQWNTREEAGAQAEHSGRLDGVTSRLAEYLSVNAWEGTTPSREKSHQNEIGRVILRVHVIVHIPANQSGKTLPPCYPKHTGHWAVCSERHWLSKGQISLRLRVALNTP